MSTLSDPSIRAASAAATAVAPGSAEQWAQLWFGVQRYEWRTLALVPAAKEQSTLDAARAMLDVARRYHLVPVRLLDAIAVGPTETAAIVAQMVDSLTHDERTLVALASPLTHPSAIPIARAASAAVLVVPLGVARGQDARRVIDTVGREHFVGTIAVRSAR